MVAQPRTGVYPGTFNPPTVAHLRIAGAARAAHRLERVDLVISRHPLGKDVERPRLSDRLAVLRAEEETHEWLRVRLTDERLLVDIARGYDILIMGADKWAQIHETRWYSSPAERDRAVASLPTPAIAPRPPHDTPSRHRLDVPDDLLEVSSTAARRGRRDLMTEAAARFDQLTGAWSDPDRYDRWRTGSIEP